MVATDKAFTYIEVDCEMCRDVLIESRLMIVMPNNPIDQFIYYSYKLEICQNIYYEKVVTCFQNRHRGLGSVMVIYQLVKQHRDFILLFASMLTMSNSLKNDFFIRCTAI